MSPILFVRMPHPPPVWIELRSFNCERERDLRLCSKPIAVTTLRSILKHDWPIRHPGIMTRLYCSLFAASKNARQAVTRPPVATGFGAPDPSDRRRM